MGGFEKSMRWGLISRLVRSRRKLYRGPGPGKNGEESVMGRVGGPDTGVGVGV